MAKGFKHGAGGGTFLNFKVAGGTSAPSNPKENTIWVNTNNPITSWQFGTEYRGKNLLKNTAKSQTSNGVTFTVNDDGSVTANGTASNASSAYIAMPITLTIGEKYIVSGCPAGGSAGSYQIYVTDTTFHSDFPDFGQGKTFTATHKECIVRVLISKGYTVNNLTFYPMIRLASEKDDTYVPYGGAENGAVWISTGTSSTAPFNALKKNNITVYPMSAKQYVNGAWVNKPIKVYQSGTWKDALLYTVVPNTGITWTTEKNVTVTQNADSTVFSHGAGDGTVHYADFSVDLTPYTKLKIVGNVSASAWSDSNSVKISIGAFSTNASFVTGFTQDIYNRDGTININNTYDISSLSGIYLIRYNARRNNDASSSHTCKFIATSIELS